MSRPSRTQKLTEKGYELLERNIRGECSSAFRAANVIVKKLNSLLGTADITHVPLVKNYLNDLILSISCVVDIEKKFNEKFAGDVETLSNFMSWFQPRLDELQKMLQSVHDWLQNFVSHVGSFVSDTNVDNVKPEDSVSQISSSGKGSKSVSVRSHRSHSGSRHSRRSASSTASSVKSAQLKESLNKASLLAEATALAKKQELMRREFDLNLQSQELMRREFELNLEKQSLELSTKLAISTAKQEVLLNANCGNSVVSTSSTNVDAKHKVITGQAHGVTGVDSVQPNFTGDNMVHVKLETNLSNVSSPITHFENAALSVNSGHSLRHFTCAEIG